MTDRELLLQVEDFVLSQPGNHITKENAISEELVGMQIFDSPLMGFASGEDELFIKEFKSVPCETGIPIPVFPHLRQ